MQYSIVYKVDRNNSDEKLVLLRSDKGRNRNVELKLSFYASNNQPSKVPL